MQMPCPPADARPARERAVPLRKLALIGVALAVGIAADHDPALATQALLGLVTFTALDRLDASIR
ncbi:hypothetical protein [Micromonospora sp. NPDC051006]|uniref:hypothetical protein n=1 Tax=Micromonospora sp. NPDC051006 TaxID=3364283 RepID=UPI0037A08247